MADINTTPSEENYLECIYRLAQSGPVRPAQLADTLGVKRPSATKAISSLAEKKLLLHEPYGEVRLTAEGKALGAAIVRRDDCLTKLLLDVLGMPPETVTKEVHRLEHVLSDDILARLEVLVSFARSSDAWLKRLHHRIAAAQREPRESTGGYLAGSSPVHKGFLTEMSEERCS